MTSAKNKQKFLLHGRRALAAKLVGVSRTTVSLWMRGERDCPRLDRLASIPVAEWEHFAQSV